MDNHIGLILAAGLGTRMNSDIPKVLHLFDKKPLISRIVEKLIGLGIREIVVVIGHKGETVKSYIEKNFGECDVKFRFVTQKLLKGSGRAVYESIKDIKNSSSVLIISGDVPLVKEKTIKALYKKYISQKLDAAVLSCVVGDVKSYGRIIRDEKNRVMAITEADELKEEQKGINEINSGIYIFKTEKLIKAVSNLKPKGKKKEFYLTDAVENIYKERGFIDALKIYDETEISGPNSKTELFELEKKYYFENIKKNIKRGAVIKDYNTVYISEEAVIGKDSVIYNDSHIYGRSKIGKNVIIGPYVIIEDSVIEDNCVIKPFTYISKSKIRNSTSVGPFSHIRPDSDIGPSAKIGNFSEIKKSRIRKGSKVPHLSYVGDTDMGEGVNIGAGTITCNYDGKNKHKTIISDGAFIGSNTNLVAPVKIGKNSLIGAGSTITEDVPDNSLAIARARQVVKNKKN
ncbi:MAG TPA: bifunctional UDP-N-acetylglucosamine diphosphorylase/glucosamine-1-phosphate N-acetyltransferase GlmU [Elusimicrobiales bacterium]|nr:bifunctional UDP-N-acetylglucosamine diphosphorylase/glucosamine-1-phosphate N-acetyltransferase GlmU [Elusimicrobiales bacterium]HOL62950.1 bifunctional UDP-N-acetylglucosamine diphosphorylase/glucosamine-1-phosphate N-acetyltransferase GlmU [Elusimicrobiales bacterium]HPO94458.1 bifunctional UDP-N-acetylglucosamine diphosphorylase/glucosamine-1-phosphate N-acetyltransferase GlmU [Elusimicrobiales bacterium]